MTVGVGLVCSDGVIVASDSMASRGPVAADATKVFCLDQLPFAWTGAGSAFVIEEVATAMRDLQASLLGDPGRAADLAAVQAGDRDQVRRVLREAVWPTLQRCYAQSLPHGLNTANPQGSHPHWSEFLFLGFIQGRPLLLHFFGDGSCGWGGTDGFDSVGSGGPFAAVCQALMEHYTGTDLTVADGQKLAYRAIERTIKVSSGGVGLPVQIAVVDGNGARILSDDDLNAVDVAVERWIQLERESLRMPDEPSAPLETPPEFPTAG